MSESTTERDWVSEIGKPAYESIAEMVAALECDYDRLEELREAAKNTHQVVDFGPGPDDQTQGYPIEGSEAECIAWMKDNPGTRDGQYGIQEVPGHADDAEELAELEAAAKPCGNECSSREDAEEMIQSDALGVLVRSDWVSPGEEMTAGEFELLLATGGPAVRIRGELDQHGEPCRAWLEVQDWFKPWTQYFPADRDTLLTYARCFYYGS